MMCCCYVLLLCVVVMCCCYVLLLCVVVMCCVLLFVVCVVVCCVCCDWLFYNSFEVSQCNNFFSLQGFWDAKRIPLWSVLS